MRQPTRPNLRHHRLRWRVQRNPLDYTKEDSDAHYRVYNDGTGGGWRGDWSWALDPYHWHTGSHVITSELAAQKPSTPLRIQKQASKRPGGSSGMGLAQCYREPFPESRLQPPHAGSAKLRDLPRWRCLTGDSLLAFTRNIGGDDSRVPAWAITSPTVAKTVGMASVVTGEMITVCALTSTMKPVTRSMGTTFTTSAPKAVW